MKVVLGIPEEIKNMMRKFGLIVFILLNLNLLAQEVPPVDDSLNLRSATNQKLTEQGLYLDAVKAALMKEDDKAVQLFESLLTSYPNNVASKYELAQIYLRKNDFVRGTELIEDAVKAEPANVWYKKLLADFYEASGDNKKWAQLLSQLIAENPDKIEFYEKMVNANLMLQKPVAAVETLDKMIEKFGYSDDLAQKKYVIYDQSGNKDKAAKELTRIIEMSPEKAQNYYLLAELYFKANKTDEAIGVLNKLEEKLPNDEYVCFTLAEYYRKLKKDALFVEAFERGIQNKFVSPDTKMDYLLAFYPVNEINERNKEVITRLSNSLSSMYPNHHKVILLNSDISYFYGDFDRAEKGYLKVINQDSSMYYTWERLMLCRSQLLDSIGLLEAATAAAILFPYQPLPIFFQGIDKLQKKDYKSAIEILENGVGLLTDQSIGLAVQYYASLGDAYNSIKNFQKSDSYYEKALSVDSLSNYVLNNYSYYLSLRGQNLEKALRMSAITIKTEPYNATYLDTYGWILYKMDRLKEAKEMIQRAIFENKSPDGTVYEHLGDILFKLGEKEKAFENWEQAKKLGGYSDLLDKKIKNKELYE
jgi:tetratricopeptide (TPR) repeat protein